MMGVHVEKQGDRPKWIDDAFEAWSSAMARADGSIPIVELNGPEWPGRLFVIHPSDLRDLAAQFAARDASPALAGA